MDFSLFGDLKFSTRFAHFDYVNPQAPKGGTVRQAAFGTYDNFNVAWPDERGSSLPESVSSTRPC